MIQQSPQFKTPHFPTHPQHTPTPHDSHPITTLIQSYHHPSWIQLQDQIQYCQPEQYLKRYYRAAQFRNKIRLLGDYYRYHVQMPRMFMRGVARVMEVNVEEKREVEYVLVTREMGDGRGDGRGNGRGGGDGGEDGANSDFDGLDSYRSYRNEGCQKLIKDVELSYEDFEDRPVKKIQRNQNAYYYEFHQQLKSQKTQFPAPKHPTNPKPTTTTITTSITTQKHTNKQQKQPKQNNNHKSIKRVDSIKFKGSFLVFKPKSEHQNKKSSGQKQQKLQGQRVRIQNQVGTEENRVGVQPKYKHPRRERQRQHEHKPKPKNKSKSKLKHIDNYLTQNKQNKDKQKDAKSGKSFNNSQLPTTSNSNSNSISNSNSGNKKNGKVSSNHSINSQANYGLQRQGGLSRSKSRAQLQVFNSNNINNNNLSGSHSSSQNHIPNFLAKKFESNPITNPPKHKQHMPQHFQHTQKNKSNKTSLQNSINKSLSRKNILNDNYNLANMAISPNITVSRKGSKTNINSYNYNEEKQKQKEKEKEKDNHHINVIYQNQSRGHGLSRKGSKSGIQGAQVVKKMFNRAIEIKKKK